MRGESIVDKKPVGHTTVLEKAAQEAVRVLFGSLNKRYVFEEFEKRILVEANSQYKSTAIREACI